MATVGVSRPYVAQYSAANGAVSYTKGVRFAKATQLSATIETGDSNNLYADNGIAESDKSFAGGSLSVGVDDIEQEASALILGAATNAVTIDGKEVTELVFDDDTSAPFLGFGCIIKKVRDKVTKWRAIVFTKVQFGIPEDAATTQGESIEWQTPTLEAAIMRDESEKRRWKREATFDTEADAEAYIKHCLNITEVPAK